MKKDYKLMFDCDDPIDDEESFVGTEMECIWLQSGDSVVQLPDEIVACLLVSDILGIT